MSEAQMIAVRFFVCVVGFGALNRKLKRDRRNEENAGLLASVSTGGRVCGYCGSNNYKDCCYCDLDFDCQCKNEVCIEIRKKYRQKRKAMMAALVVGQDVNLDTGMTNISGKVVKIRWRGVDVQIGGSGEPLRFDKEGQCRADPDPMSLFSPWYIDEVPFAERQQTMREQTMREHQPFIVWWKSATYEQRLALVTKYYTTRLALSLSPLAPAETVARFADISDIRFLMVELAKEAPLSPYCASSIQPPPTTTSPS